MAIFQDFATNCTKVTLDNGQKIDIPSRQLRKQERGKTEEIILSKQPILEYTQEEVAAWYEHPDRQEFTGDRQPKSWLGVPMLLEGRVVGVIAIYDFQKENAYGVLDQQILEAMANHAAIALDNAHLFYRRVKSLQVLNEIAQDLSSKITVSEDNIVETLHDRLHSLTPANGLYFAFYDKQTSKIRATICQRDQHFRPITPRYLDEEKRDRTEEVILTGKSLLHRTREDLRVWYDQPGHFDYNQEAIGCTFIVPMIAEGDVIGAIAAFDTEHENIFDETDVEIMSTIANQAAIAIMNARLYEKNVRLNAEKNASEQLAVLGTAMGTLQHRINNTFNLINPNLVRLRRRIDTSTDPEIEKILDIIERNARYTSDIIARIMEPLKHSDHSSINLNALLDDLSKQTHQRGIDLGTEPELEISLEFDESIPLIEGPAGQIAEVFKNLMENACKAMNYKGILTITSRQYNNVIEVFIADTGPGIAPNIQERLFEIPVPSKEPGSSSGLGLWLSKLILKKIGGEISIFKSNKKGTIMLVKIPESSKRG